jgi:carboxyl-terminal processing protease
MLQYTHSIARVVTKSMKEFKNTELQPVNEYRRSILIGAAAGLLLALAFTAGFLLRDIARIPTVSASNPDEVGYPLVDEVQNLLDAVYLRDQPEYTARQYAAIRGVLEAVGDKNTFFIEPPVAQSEAHALAGTYGGIGVLLRRDEKGQLVLHPYEDSPAIKAGITDGDALLTINGETIEGMQQDAVDQKMRGEVKAGSGVEIAVRKPDSTELTIFIEFAVINVPSVIWRVLPEDTRIGYVQILRFTNRTPDELKTALTDLNAQQVTALILDLRGNTGGLLEESIKVASEFLPGGIISYERDKTEERALEAEATGLAPDLPLVVLVNQYTASASEIVAGAIRDRQRGILLGQKTYGKGTVQQIFTLSDGSSVHITAAEWLTPNHTPLDGVGLEPDIYMQPDENGRDIETGEAVRYLQRLLSEGEGA